MSSRQEEKERRRQERLELERREKAAAARKRRLGIVAGTVLAVAALAAVAIAVSSGGGGKSGAKPTNTSNIKPVPIPAQKTSGLAPAAKAAGCQLRTYPNFGRNHTTSKVKYKTNPPTSGNHNPTPASDGSYVGVTTPAPENYVHALEHGRIEVQYKPGLPRREIGQLESLFNERQQYMLLFQNNTNMPFPVAATAWTHSLNCPQFNQKVFDAIRAFRDAYTLKAPEFIQQAE